MDKIILQIKDKYIEGSNIRLPMWEKMINSKGVYSENGWEEISNFVKSENEIIIFFEPDVYNYGFNISGDTLKSVLSDCFGFVFYISNPSLDYLICFNDHNYIIGSGDIECWIESITA